MFQTFVNCFKIPELRDRIILTLGLLVAARVGANIPLPGLDPRPIQEYFASQASNSGGNLLGLYNMFTGGAMLKGALFALGIMPYISAQIVFQMLGAAVPALARLQQEGEVGRQKITQYTRYATVVVCVIQALLLVMTLENPARLFSGFTGNIVLMDKTMFLITSTVFMTAGTVVLMWIGEQITERGVGNGFSILITVGILADLPSAAAMTYRLFAAPLGSEGKRMGIPEGVLMCLLFVGVVMGLVMITQAIRKIPIQQAKRVVGRKVYGGQSSYMPLRVNFSGVMPIIFASAICLFCQTMFSWVGVATNLRFLIDAGSIFQHGDVWYYIIYTSLLVIFSYVWVSIMFKPIQIADDLKKYGSYIPAVRPGEPTARYLDFVMTRITAFGTVALVAIALFPDMLYFSQNIPYQVSQFFGGTGMLITVGVLLDLLRQIETYLLQRHYDGFLRKGRIRGTSMGRTRQIVDTQGLSKARTVMYLSGGLIISGLVAFVINYTFLS